jgi:predicted DNA-binding transcriptional regulator AlpA
MGKAPPRTHHIDRRAAQIVAARDDSDGDDDLLSTNEVANWLSLSTQWLEIARSKGYGPRYVRISPRKIMYLRSDVLAWLGARTRGGTGERRATQLPPPSPRPR